MPRIYMIAVLILNRLYLDLMPEFPDPVWIRESSCIGIKKDNCLETGKLSVIHLNVPEGLNQFCHHSHSNVVNYRIL